jgi:RHS repeat-associated protein
VNAAGWQYNPRGDLIRNGAGEQTVYDAEGRISVWCSETQSAQVCGTGAGQVWAARMVYDAEGRRVRKETTSGGTEYYQYGADQELLADYGSGGMSGVQFLTADALGSTRVVTDGAGEVTNRWDYDPYGGLIAVAGTGEWRSGKAGYRNTAGPRQRFTGKERDAETGLDYFGARYLSSAQGRFTSPDAPFADQFPENPQSWNLYSYTRNNPLGTSTMMDAALRKVSLTGLIAPVLRSSESSLNLTRWLGMLLRARSGYGMSGVRFPAESPKGPRTSGIRVSTTRSQSERNCSWMLRSSAA